jgi:hypothetical protein
MLGRFPLAAKTSPVDMSLKPLGILAGGLCKVRFRASSDPGSPVLALGCRMVRRSKSAAIWATPAVMPPSSGGQHLTEAEVERRSRLRSVCDLGVNNQCTAPAVTCRCRSKYLASTDRGALLAGTDLQVPAAN